MDTAARPLAKAVSVRALVLGLLLSLLTGLIVRQVALVYNAGEIESSVPPVPAVMFLFGLGLLNPLLGRLRPRWRLTSGELLVIYGILAVSTAMSGRFLLRALFGFLTAPRYYDTLQPISETLPGWLAPDDTRVVTQFFESAAAGQVPWAAWLAPLGLWMALALLIWLGMFCTVELFHRRWGEQEHLRYPLLYLPLELAGGSGTQAHPFIRNPLMWAGFGMGFWYALPVVVSPFWSNFPDWKVTGYPFRALTSAPWNELSSIYLRPLPHLIGLGYLMSSDNLFTIWAGYLGQRLAWVAATAYGYRRPGWHLGGGLDLQQTLGAMVTLALWLGWGNRRAIAAALTEGPWPQRLRVLGAIGGIVGATWLGAALGLPGKLVLALVLLLNASSLVYARIRAEVGLPSYYAVPFEFQERDAVFDMLGSRAFRGDAGLSAISRFSLMGWMTQGQFPATAAYHVENMELARRNHAPTSVMLWVTLGSAAVGLAIGCWTHLTTFYDMGALSAVGAGGNGFYEVNAARRSYTKLLSQLSAATDFSLAPNLYRVAGGLIVLLLAHLRGRYVGFPLTPWSYVIASTYGTTFWTSFLITWVAQKLILRYGGAQSYRRAIPLFLGISFGYMTATVAAVISTFASGKALSFSGGKRLYFDI